ncbi:hypothetical protein GCM10010168_51310 [Actinoplanes ianthinogenes]|uniref:Uncharacterized protein n=1 Tax=Actinoplanes ianthinogenes TaxID=122358 RepID=A0ABM7M3L6_9ACTN|nr:hypothetical protein [Actinoplanes ianthinogenes]BCJ46182.1 hypothetical protein Aiant_68390 [Actinoplanes ianthinogenes]GGR26864.1 hypothetical protein GCM10010168_51310 [Actinoplanes ianthinogenes]
MIPTTIRGLVQTRSQLTDMLRAFRVHGPRGLFAFGRHHRAEAVILPWPLFERLTDAAQALEDAAHVVELDRRRRNPRGTGKVTLGMLAELLGVTPPARTVAPPARGRQITAWPAALDDLLRIREEQPPAVCAVIAEALVAIAAGRQTGAALVSAPGQPVLGDHRRVVVPLGAAGGAVIVVFSPAGGTLDLLAVLPAGPLVSALQDLESL